MEIQRKIIFIGEVVSLISLEDRLCIVLLIFIENECLF